MHLHLPSAVWCSSNTFSSVQYDGLVASGPTVPWNKMTSLFIDLPTKREKSKASLSLRSNKGMWLIYKACAPNHTNTIMNHIEVVGCDFFLHCIGKGEEGRGHREVCGRTELPPSGEPRRTWPERDQTLASWVWEAEDCSSICWVSAW